MTQLEIASAVKTSRHVMPENTDSPRKIIEHIVRAHQFDYDGATQALLVEMDEDAALREYVEAEGARYCVRSVTGSVRSSSTGGSGGSPAAPGEPFRRHYSAIKSFSKDFTLPGGMPIGEAREADIKKAIEYYGVQEAGMRKHRKFCEAVGKKMVPGKRAGDVISDAQFIRMYREAR